MKVLSLPQESSALTVKLPKVKMVDKPIDDTQRYFSVRTQHRIQHFLFTTIAVNQKPIVGKL